MGKKTSEKREQKHQQLHRNGSARKEKAKRKGVDAIVYIKAILKDNQGKLHEVKVSNKSEGIIIPTSKLSTFKFAFATNKLLLSFWRKIRKYKPENYTLIKLETDNAFLANQISKKLPKVQVEFYPLDPEEAKI